MGNGWVQGYFSCNLLTKENTINIHIVHNTAINPSPAEPGYTLPLQTV